MTLRILPSTAYLVASFDTSGPKPVYIGSDIFSEPTPTTRGRTWQVTVLSVEGKDFGEARRKLVKRMLLKEISGPLGYWRWLRPEILAIVKREQEYRKRLVAQGFVVRTPKRIRRRPA